MVTLGCNQYAIQEDLLTQLPRNSQDKDSQTKENLLEILIRFQSLSLNVLVSLLDIASKESEEIDKVSQYDTFNITGTHIL